MNGGTGQIARGFLSTAAIRAGIASGNATTFVQRNALRTTMAAFIEAVEAGVDEHRLCGVSETDQLLQAAFDRGMEQMAREMEPLLRDEAQEFEVEVAADADASTPSLSAAGASASASASGSSEHGSGKGVRFSGDAAADSGRGDDEHASGSASGSSNAKREFRRIASLVAGAERVLGGLQRP